MNPHRNLFSQYPLVQIAIPFCVGICAAEYGPVRFVYLVIAGAICSITVFVGLWKNWLTLAGCALLTAMFFVGVVLAGQQRRPQAISGGQTLVLTGVLDAAPEYARDRVYLRLKVEQGLEGSVFLLAESAHFPAVDLRYGTRIRVTARFRRTDNYRNPGVSPLSEYLERKGYVATGVIKDPGAIERLGDTTVFPPLAWLYDWRVRLQREIDSRFTPETAGVLDAALLGNRHNLSASTSDRFREGGTFHVLVISGLHISFIGGIVLFAVRRFTRRRLLQFVLPASFVWCYSLAVGAEASVVRAALMFTFAGFGAVLFRPATSLNALGGASLFLLVQSPKEIFDPSFQLTFLSVLAIVMIAWPLLRKFSGIGAWYPSGETPYPPNCSRLLKAFCETLFWSEKSWQREIARSSHHYKLFKVLLATVLERFKVQWCVRYVFGAVVVSTAVQVVLLPQMTVYFHRLSLSSLLLNIVVGVLLALLAAVALVGLLLANVGTSIATPVIKLAEAINWLMVHSVDPFSDAGIASSRLPEYTGWMRGVYVLYYVPLLMLVITLHRWEPLSRFSRKRSIVPLTVVQLTLIAIVILHPFSAARADAQLHIDFLDVGQGDSALITMPDGTTLLVDGGGRPRFRSETTVSIERETRSIGESVVSEYLWWRGLDRVDYVLATHADADHIDGLNDVVRNFSVNTALVGRTPADDPEFARFAQSLIDTNLQTVQIGDVMRFGEVELHVLWPPPGVDSTNDDSVVLKLQFRERSILLTGDIEKRGEEKLLPRELQADVVKVSHHGSKTSSTAGFVSATKPRLAIISVGQDSMFGHPHAEVVERWRQAGAEILTTGKCGTITVRTDGTNLWVREFVPRCGSQN